MEMYRSGRNEADSKFLEAPVVSSAEEVRRTRLCVGSDFTISYRSCVFFLRSSGARITLEIYGELSERSKVRHSKSCDQSPKVNIYTWKRIEVVVTSCTRNHVSTLEVQTAEKPVTMRVCGQVQIVNWGLFYPVVLPNFHGLNFAGKWL